MDEVAYRELYHTLNKNRCVFEKALNNRRCDCQLKRRFLLATREGVGCLSVSAQASCEQFLQTMRQKARFALRVVTIDGPMPHNKELQVQAGGTLFLQQLTFPDKPLDPPADQPLMAVDNIHATLEKALSNYGSIDKLPYGELVKGIVSYQSRPKRKRKPR